MNITEAKQVNTVIGYWLEMDAPGGAELTTEQVIDAMAALADRAHRALHAGVTGDRVRDRWAELYRPGATT